MAQRGDAELGEAARSARIVATVACVSLGSFAVAWVASFRAPPSSGNVASAAVPLVVRRPRLYSVGDWYSEQCRNHFSRSLGGANRTGRLGHRQRPAWYSVPRRTTVDDLCTDGREKGFLPPRAAQELVVVDALRVIFVPVRKAASTNIRAALQRFFGADVQWCLDVNRTPGDIKPCGQIVYGDYRCTSQCLSSKHSDYFVFAFVRDPLARAYSAFEFFWGQKFSTMAAMHRLERLKTGDCLIDHHWESQARSLSTALPVLGEGSELKHELTFDFIGHAERLADDMQKVVDALRSGLELRWDLDDAQRSVLERKLDSFMHSIRTTRDYPRGKETNRSHLASIRSKPLDALIKETYSQDCACFGCPPV